MIKVKKVRKGVTLIEVVIAIVIIAIMMIPIGNIVMKTIRVNKDAEAKQKATNIAQKALDEFSNYTELKVNRNAAVPRTGKISLGSMGDIDVEIKNQEISFKDVEKKITAGEKSEYIVNYTMEKNPDVSQDLTYDTTRDVDKYAAILEFTGSQLIIKNEINGDKFEAGVAPINYSTITASNRKQDIYLHILQDDEDGHIIGFGLYSDKDGNNPIQEVQINDSTLKSLKIVQTKEYQGYLSNDINIYASTDINSDNIANVELFEDKDIKSKNEKNINIYLDDTFGGNLYRTPKYIRKTLVNGQDKAKPLGDLYDLTVVVKKKGYLNSKNEEKTVFEGKASSNIFMSFR